MLPTPTHRCVSRTPKKFAALSNSTQKRSPTDGWGGSFDAFSSAFLLDFLAAGGSVPVLATAAAFEASGEAAARGAALDAALSSSLAGAFAAA